MYFYKKKGIFYIQVNWCEKKTMTQKFCPKK